MYAIFFKEWIKTRRIAILMLIVCLGSIAYDILRIAKVISLHGAGHLWEVMLAKDTIFIALPEYILPILGILLALFQFIPEMRNSCFKLTLHLPISNLKAVYAMLLYGFIILTVCFALSLLVLFLYLQSIMAVELYTRIILSILPWYLSGYAAYFLLSWICMEPTWRWRIVYLIAAVLLLRIYHLSATPESYNAFLPWLTLLTLSFASLTVLSVLRFKSGKQD